MILHRLNRSVTILFSFMVVLYGDGTAKGKVATAAGNWLKIETSVRGIGMGGS